MNVYLTLLVAAAAVGVSLARDESKCENPIDEGKWCPNEPHGVWIKYGFNKATQECEEFSWKGCGGNSNSFAFMKDCNANCVRRCKQPLKIGTGSNSQRRYYYDQRAKQCKEFQYKGSGGNLNNFMTKRQCNDECNKVDPCRYSMDVGVKCGFDGPQDFEKRYAFNEVTAQCHEFTYKRCGGNANRFYTKEECNKECVNHIDICHLPKNVGTGNQIWNRYYYNPYTRRCEYFGYKGKNGNTNNFRYKSDCEKKCKGH